MYYHLHGRFWHVQNLLWSYEKLLNSCDDTLRLKLEERLGDSDDYLKRGPVAF
jgi:hypothetical protein